jgi:hypothetical protein
MYTEDNIVRLIYQSRFVLKQRQNETKHFPYCGYEIIDCPDSRYLKIDTGSNQMVINQDDAENTFNSILALDVGLPGNQYPVDNFTVYGPADQGKPLPDGYPGVAPGTSLYAHITVEIPIGDMVGLPSLSGVTYYLPIEELVSANPQGKG